MKKNDIALQKFVLSYNRNVIKEGGGLDPVKPWQPLAFLKREKVALHSTHFWDR